MAHQTQSWVMHAIRIRETPSMLATARHGAEVDQPSQPDAAAYVTDRIRVSCLS
jgi:hypothetical protein